MNAETNVVTSAADQSSVPPVQDIGLTAEKVPLIDVFAGCGGFSEGFLAYDGVHQFDLALAVDNDNHAHRTHLLRTFVHQFDVPPEEYYALIRSPKTPDEKKIDELYLAYPEEADAAEYRVLCAELGAGDAADREIHDLIDCRLQGRRDWVLIGGPPCQAYSIAGRSRNRAKEGYEAAEDKRHFLYREYLKIIAEHWPAVFVMENVPGVIHSKVGNKGIWKKILEDLADPVSALDMMDYAGEYEGYGLYSLVEPDRGHDLFKRPLIEPDEFIVECDQYGVPQSRKRVFVLGVRSDLVDAKVSPVQLVPADREINCGEVIEDLPRLRSAFSQKYGDSNDTWLDFMKTFDSQNWWEDSEELAQIRKVAQKHLSRLRLPKAGTGGSYVRGRKVGSGIPTPMREWLVDERLDGACNHESKAHMPKDIHRYLFAACHTLVNENLLRLVHFPKDLLPEHENIDATDSKALSHSNFADRFAVQAKNRPARTVVSHIAKDGHYYIHPDPSQGRSFSVREAARIQTFPDNYFFPGPRTEGYRQVGNAVPPYLARQIAAIVDDVLIQARR